MLKTRLIPLVVGGALLVGGVSAGTAYASSPPSTPKASASVPAGATPTHKVHLRAWLRAHRDQLRRQAVVVSAKSMGVTPQALGAELRSGKSIAEVAAEHNVSIGTVTGALASAATAKINAAVSNGKLTASQAQKIESRLPDYLARVVNRVH
jgi:hypothetical protein